RGIHAPASVERSTLKGALGRLPTQRARQRPSLTTSRVLEHPARDEPSKNGPLKAEGQGLGVRGAGRHPAYERSRRRIALGRLVSRVWLALQAALIVVF